MTHFRLKEIRILQGWLMGALANPLTKMKKARHLHRLRQLHQQPRRIMSVLRRVEMALQNFSQEQRVGSDWKFSEGIV